MTLARPPGRPPAQSPEDREGPDMQTQHEDSSERASLRQRTTERVKLFMAYLVTESEFRAIALRALSISVGVLVDNTSDAKVLLTMIVVSVVLEAAQERRKREGVSRKAK